MTTQDRQTQVTSQTRLVNALQATCSTATALTALEVVAALELVKGQLVVELVMAQAQASAKKEQGSGIIHPN